MHTPKTPVTQPSCVIDLQGTKWYRRAHLIAALGVSPRTFDRHLKSGDIGIQRKGKLKLYTLRHPWKSCVIDDALLPSQPTLRHLETCATDDANPQAQLARLRRLVALQQQLIDQQQHCLTKAQELLDAYRTRS